MKLKLMSALFVCLIVFAGTASSQNKLEGSGLSFDDYLAKIKANNKLVLVDFSAVWCGPCKMLKPKVDRVVEKNKATVDLFPVDVDKNPAVANAMHINGIPLLVLYKNGKEVWRNLGLGEEDDIAGAIKKYSK